MFIVFNEATSDRVGEYSTLAEAKAAVREEPEDRFIHDDLRMVGHFTDDGGMTWETLPYETESTDPVRAKWAQDEADYQAWFAQYTAQTP